MKVITKQWLDFAKTDLLNCELIVNEEFLTNITAFHSQQATEKCFKAIIEEKGFKTERIHNLYNLYSQVMSYLDFEVDLNMLELLDKIYLTSRYPGEMGLLPEGKPTLDEAKEMYEFAKYVFSKTNKMLSKSLK
jgi:HEPN domain-containing protein